MYTDQPAPSFAFHGHELLLSVLDHTEAGVAVVDADGRAIYLNATACRILRCERRTLPAWTAEHLRPMLARLRRSRAQVVERWAHSDVTLRVRARSLGNWSGHTALEIHVAHAAGTDEVAELLSRSLRLSPADGQLLEMVWRGMSNDDIAQREGVRLGTVKSRLFRLYQKLGVHRRPAAVLRAQEVIAA